MSQTHEQWTNLLSEYLDGTLAEKETAELEAHLDACAGCRAVLGGLRDIVQRAHGLGPMMPRRDLWPDISGAIGAHPGFDDAGPEPAGPALRRRPGRTGPRAGPRRAGFWLTLPQLAAAAVVLMLGSASMTWWFGVRPVRAGESPVRTGSPVVQVSDTSGGTVAVPARIAVQLHQLEDTLASVRTSLDPMTQRIIQRNLAVIDRAISESRNALASDPGDAFLREHLDRTYERKVTYLREATRIVRGSSAP